MRYSTRLCISVTLLSWVGVVRSQNCQLQVPADPLTAKGLATPYMLTGCNQLDFANQGAFVEAAILDPATGNIHIYNPLVINAGMVPTGNNQNNNQNAQRDAATGFFIPPIVPTLPNNAVVGIWFGSNAAMLTLTGNTGGCVNGLGNSVFGQFAHCNGQAWFNAAKTAVNNGLTKLPAPGTGSGGQGCPTTHDFRIVDQDQSDNVVTTYLLIGNNTLAQNTPANTKANPSAKELSNASDNALLNVFIYPSLGCAPYQNPCTTCPTGNGPALATDELLANFFPPAGGSALVPLNDPMVLVNGQQSLDKVNLYREGTGQPQADNNNASAMTYCQQIVQGGIFVNGNQGLFTNAGSPAAGMANNLFTFLAMRFSASFGPAPGLGCTALLNVMNPVTLTTDGNGVVTAATINTQILQGIMGNNVTATQSVSNVASTAASSGSAGATNAASPSATSSVPSAAPSSASGNTTNSVTATSSSTSTATGAIGSTTSVPTSSAIPPCGTGSATGTVTDTTIGCSTQAGTPSASPSKPHGGRHGEWKNWNNGGSKRSLDGKNRIASFH
ncbi:hypothetical protein JVU11DRAFT_12540 [Chiua virens]|nr:hypothetical protein JVU11DRAFT_12540 [Chiua virens]